MPDILLTNLAGGEVAPESYGRVESPVYLTASKWLENFIPKPQGALEWRAGTKYVHPSLLNGVARKEAFKSIAGVEYTLMFTDLKLQFFLDDVPVLTGTTKSISAITAASPGVLTVTSHGYANGDEIYITGIAGMTELNGRYFRVANQTTHTFTLVDLFGNAVDTSAYTAYSSGGTTEPVYTIASPIGVSILFQFQMRQIGNVVYLVHRSLEPRKLTFTSTTSWAIATYVRTADPFTGAGEYPGAITFYEGRAIFLGTTNKKDLLAASRAPQTDGTTRYDDFTTGADADHAIITRLSTNQKSVDDINWAVGLRQFIAVGTSLGVRGVDGGGDSAITPSSVRTRPIDEYATSDVMPVVSGSVVFYMQKGNRILRSFEYELFNDTYKSFSRSSISSHMTRSGIKQLALQQGAVDLIWMVRNDGEIVAVNPRTKEDPTGWHHYSFGVGALVNSVMARPTDIGYDRVEFMIERTINSTTVRYSEFLTEAFESPRIEDFYTDESTQDDDDSDFDDAVYEELRASRYLDSHAIYDGSVASSAITITPAAVTGDSVVFTASGALFAASDVGREIWKKYEDRAGGGRAVIIGYTDSTHVTCEITSDFDVTTAIPYGSWYLTADTITGLHHLEGEEVEVVTDGRRHPTRVVTGGIISLGRQTALGYAGFLPRGIWIPLPLITVSRQGIIFAEKKNIEKVDILVSNTIGTKYGSSLYNLHQIPSTKLNQKTGRPPRPFSGFVGGLDTGGWSKTKDFVLVHDEPYPCMINALSITIANED